MADVKISALSNSAALDGSELVPIVQSGVTVKTTAQAIADLAAGGVTSVNTFTGAVVLDTDDISEGATNLYYTNARVATYLTGYIVPISLGGTGQSNAQAGLNNLFDIGSHTDGDVVQLLSGNVQLAPFSVSYAAINAALGLPTNVFLFSNAANEVVGYGEWNIDPTIKALNAQLVYQPNNLSVNQTMFNWNVNIDPLQNSPNDTVFVHNISANLDSALSGFSLGTAGQAVTLVNGGFNFQGSATYGRLILVNLNNGFGNGTDPLTFNGHSGIFAGFSTQPNVTIDGSCSGYAYNLALDAATTTTSNFAITAYSDFSQLPVDVYGYQGFVVQPNIATIKNNSNFNGMIVNPTIVDFEGNAGFYGFNVGGTITNQGASNGYQGGIINPTITHLTQNSTGLFVGCTTTDGTAEWQGVFITTQNVATTGSVKGLTISCLDTHQAIDATGHCNLSSGFDLVSSLGQQYGHVIGGTIRVPDATTITGTDVLANNMAFTVDTGDATSDWTAASLVGLTTLGFVGQIIGDGTLNGAVNFCLNGYADVHNGHIDQVNNFFAAAIPGGGTGTMDVSILYYGDRPAGSVATDEWGIRIDDSGATGMENFLTKLAIGTTSKKVTNATVALEVAGGAFLAPSFDNAGEAALTAVNGMIIYNTDTNKFRGYENGAWANLI